VRVRTRSARAGGHENSCGVARTAQDPTPTRVERWALGDGQWLEGRVDAGPRAVEGLFVDDATLRLIAVVGTLGALGLWVLSTFIWRVTGTWERELSDDDRAEGAKKEKITFGQLGPFVTGRREVKGGYQEYSGVMFGRSVTLTRRDHGVKALAAMGFPDGVAQKLDGEVMARLKLSLEDSGLYLVGTFEPQKVEFTHQPERVTGMFFLPGQQRRYRRVETVGVRDRVPVLDDVEAETTQA
jgi:hypothetical protein